MQLVCPVPTIHFKPVENKKKSGKGKQTSLLVLSSMFPSLCFGVVQCNLIIPFGWSTDSGSITNMLYSK